MKRKGSVHTKVIGYPWVPVVLILFSAALIYYTVAAQPYQSLIGLLLVLSGVPFYYFFKRRNNVDATIESNI
jgi:basic amino acid/polyamine antiporter, APA family